MSSLFTSQAPSSGNNSDGAPGITFATAMQFGVVGDVTGVRFFATTTVSGVYTASLWGVTAADPNGSGGTLLASQIMGVAPTPGAWNSVNFVAPVAVNTTDLYKVSVFSGDGRYAFTPTFPFPVVNGDITGPANGSNPVGLGNLNQGSFTINAANSYPTGGGSSCYFADALFTPSGGLTPVTSTLDVRWRVSNRVTSTLDARWRVFNRILSTLMVRWRVTPDVAPVTGDTAVLTAQRQATLAYIAYDPTTIELIPCSRVATPSGGFTETDGAPRAAQSVKMIELAYDQRPTITVAGVERILDYHLMGRWDMAIAVGDYWIDEEGTRWDIVGFSEGWDYMTKAYASRHIPRGARP